MTHNSYGSEGEKLPRHRDRPENGNGKRVPTWVGLVLQALAIIITLGLAIRSTEKDILVQLESVRDVATAADSHAKAAMDKLLDHTTKEHKDKDRARMLMHNSCFGAQSKGCHPSVKSE